MKRASGKSVERDMKRQRLVDYSDTSGNESDSSGTSDSSFENEESEKNSLPLVWL
jgi:hypothetical protein